MTDEQKIEKIDATAEEIARAIFAAADRAEEDEEEKDRMVQVVSPGNI